MKHLLMSVILLMMACQCLGADIYVDKDYAGGGSDGTITRPWLTIQIALDTQTAGNTDTILIAEGTYDEGPFFDASNVGSNITMQPEVSEGIVTIKALGGASRNIEVNGMTTGSITINDIILRSTGSITNGLIASGRNAGDDVSITVTNCTFGHLDDTAAVGIKLEDLAAPARTITLTNCTFVNVTQFIQCRGASAITITGGTYTSASSFSIALHGMVFGNTTPIIMLTDFEMTYLNTSIARFAILFDGNVDYNHLRIADVTINGSIGGIHLTGTFDALGHAEFLRNNITIDAAVNANYCIAVGLDTSDPGDLGYINIYKNDCKYIGASSSHCYLIGQGALNVDCEKNQAKNGNIQYVIKGGTAHFWNNIGDGPSGIILKGAVGSFIHNNTMYITDGACLTLSELTSGGRDTEACRIINNIFYYTGNDTMIDGEATGAMPDPQFIYMDYNCWYTEGNEQAWADPATETNPTTFTEWVDLWDIWGNMIMSKNEENTINVDPRFVDPANGDFTPTNPLVLTGGKPDVYGNPTSIGAIGLSSRPRGGYRSRYR